ncbi:MAG: imidazole glycerol phosphate synthase subunit HisH [Liquorilactobacillus nagelii]|jgi:glutamine amidotransferase|uniref:Imidazole glycerol phosphate synthase subunit HisH n=1 Tax=Liquorilactobacillus nagelii TaxID=82688 RepID=A0A3S6R1W8_9LACO|nr:imidazole glycerol phosphate synthase subunit HisH [Liquorilactobacillus nagelii]AUJ32577.1 imidazole glycerol phosphate synthase subunit HisH [Liquorilactobacillus nagelii]MCC7616728.1 imidazole glycerol phosphate synthase subunit HisH [Liquorilactobacillus nagelii]MCI1634241.1 imidazole glycerol phosphate synthase subunit HisH [Liquorilactobacillus nagelii]MCI1921310.1 imidazole glycerol phosphate synthase subunit HisH [Liquorilactobacillus nagelii]MCI1977318.1 imidazole glycerol phosphat
MLVIIDYDAGNTYNVKKAFDYLKIPTTLTADPQQIKNCDGMILPGVGAFGPAMATLQERGLANLIKHEALAGKPLLGICLGMQMLFENSTEYGNHAGLGLIPGKVVAFPTETNYRVPQMGWNQNQLLQSKKDFDFLANEYTYFVHSYYVKCDLKYIVTAADYGVQVPALVRRQQIYGTQFHPEKSGAVGLRVLQTFAQKAVAK